MQKLKLLILTSRPSNKVLKLGENCFEYQLAGILFISGLLQAQDTTSYHFAFNHMALSVKDVNRSAEFYKNVLSLPEITNRSKLEGVRWFSMAEGKGAAPYFNCKGKCGNQ
jgi:hypothetical protein